MRRESLYLHPPALPRKIKSLRPPPSMSYYRYKIIKMKGKEYGPYWYRVEGYREGKKVKQRVLEYIGKDRPIESESVREQLWERDSNLSRGLHVFRDVRKWIVFDSTNIVKLKTSTFCRTFHR